MNAPIASVRSGSCVCWCKCQPYALITLSSLAIRVALTSLYSFMVSLTHFAQIKMKEASAMVNAVKLKSWEMSTDRLLG
jgi:hypothetical protein